ncbi:hypothetical protein [Microbacterium sp. NPDC097977]|uniref:hypothetical protein n=1 Tax=Microbacterium sp. NPDC097977 TaxID=3155686 RepID=UPI0033187F06
MHSANLIASSLGPDRVPGEFGEPGAVGVLGSVEPVPGRSRVPLIVSEDPSVP